MACYEMPKYKTKNMFYRVTWEVNKSLASLFYVTKGKSLSKILQKMWPGNECNLYQKITLF